MNSKKVLIIAEAGVNHNGDLKLAKELIRVAAEAGADIVKFQTFQANAIASKVAGRADYQKENMKEDGSQIDMLKKLQLSEEDHLQLIEHCKENKIEFLSTAFDFPSIDLLVKMGITGRMRRTRRVRMLPTGHMSGKRCAAKQLITIGGLRGSRKRRQTYMATMRRDICIKFLMLGEA